MPFRITTLKIIPGCSITPTSYLYNDENLFSLDPEIIDFWGLDGPGGPETNPTGGALPASRFGVVSGAPGAVQTSKIDDSWVPGE